MKKITLSIISFFLILISLIIFYLTIFGYETNKFNVLLEKKIISYLANTQIKIDKIKIKINIKNLSFFVTTVNPNIKYYSSEVNINKIDAYFDLKSLIIGKPELKKVNIVSNEIEIKEVKSFVKYLKPSNFKKFLLNDVEKGVMTLKLDLHLKNNKIENYEINGYVKNFFARMQDLYLTKSSFIYLIKKDFGEINNLRGLVNGFQINSGDLEINNSKILSIKGNLNSILNLSKSNLDNLIKSEFLESLEDLKLSGKIQSLFQIEFDKTLKIINHNFEASGDIKKSEIKFKKPTKYLFVENKIKNLNLEKSNFNFKLEKKSKNSFNIDGYYKINNNSLQKFNFEHLNNLNSRKFIIDGELNAEINIPILNYNSKNKVVNIKSEFEKKKNSLYLNKFSLVDEKNKISINNLLLKNNKLLGFDKISVKTFQNNSLNNDFEIIFDKKIKVFGSKYDASNLTQLLDTSYNSNLYKNINKEISINIKEISTKVSDMISNFNLIGYIEKGKFSKIISKGEFKDGKYLDISLKVDKNTNKKILEIYSDLPKPLLSNYNFFDGLTGGKLLITSSYDFQNSNTNLTIENFKVKDAPGLVKLLSLADFGGMVDALSGDGLTFEKLEMSLVKNNQVLNLKELYAIGPSISILMEGYVESKTGLVSLRGTMVPAKTLNKFLSKLPIVGDILIPKEIGEGLFGISFKMKGTPGKIKTSVNPIKTLTPRFIQKALKKS